MEGYVLFLEWFFCLGFMRAGGNSVVLCLFIMIVYWAILLYAKQKYRDWVCGNIRAKTFLRENGIETGNLSYKDVKSTNEMIDLLAELDNKVREEKRKKKEEERLRKEKLEARIQELEKSPFSWNRELADFYRWNEEMEEKREKIRRGEL